MTQLKTCKEAKRYIKNLKKQLSERGLLENVDSQAMDMIEMQYHKWWTTSEFLLENGYTFKRKTREGDIIEEDYPQVKMQQDAHIQLQKLLEQYGGTANSRNKIKDIATQKDEEDPLAEFLKSDKK